MATYALTGNDTLKIDDTLVTDFADGDIISIVFPNDKTAVKTGKNGNTIFAQNLTGYNADVELRVMRGSALDKLLNSRNAEYDLDPSAFTLLNAYFSQRSGDGNAGISRIIYDLKGGVFKRGIDGKSNVEGDTEQGVALYRLTFAIGSRSIQ